MKLTRRSFLNRIAVGIAALPFAAGFARAQMKGKLGYMKIVDTAAMFMAMENGFFKAEGLELETVPMVGGAAIAPAVASGDLQIGWTNVISLYQAHARGFDFKFLCGGATNAKGGHDTHAIAVPKKSPIRSAKDLEGKTVAVNTLNNIVHLMAMAWVDKNGGASGKVKFVEVPFPQMEAALAAGRVDAASVHEPFVTASTGRGVARVLAYNWSEVAPKFLVASWFASDRWIQRNKGAARGFVKAMNRGIDAIHADRDATRKAIVKWTGLNADLAANVRMPVFEKGIAENELQATIDLTHKYQLIPRPFKAAEVVSELARGG